MRRFVYIFLPLMLSACATDTMKDGLPYLVGKPIQNAINYLGYPDDQKTIAGQDIYIWHYEKTFTTTQTVYTPYSGTAYGMGEECPIVGKPPALFQKSIIIIVTFD